MRPEADDAIQELLRLPASERSEAIAQLLSSLDGEAEASAATEWESEIKRRVDDLASGRVEPVPLAEARRRILSDE